jgi:hypothetical protein
MTEIEQRLKEMGLTDVQIAEIRARIIQFALNVARGAIIEVGHHA